MKTKPRILAIDDDENVCRFLEKALEATGDYEVIFALTGAEGVALARKELPDLVLLDLVMPDMDGLSVLKALKTNSKTVGIPVVILTGHSNPESMVESMSGYAEEYVEKPIDIDVLESKITRILTYHA